MKNQSRISVGLVCSRPRSVRSNTIAAALGLPFIVCWLSSASVLAQTALPGLVVAPSPGGSAAPATSEKKAPASRQRSSSKSSKSAKPADSEDTDDDRTAGTGRGGTSILMLVNDEPVTQYEVLQRARFLSLGGVGQQAQENFKRLAQSDATNKQFRGIIEDIVKANPGKSREQIIALIEARKKRFAEGLQQQAVASARSAAVARVSKDAKDEIIEEKLKLQEARKLGVLASDADVERMIKGIAAQNKVSEAQFAQNLKNMGVNISTMRARFRANLSWRDVIRRKFSAQISILPRDIDKFVASGGGAGGESGDELHVQRIVYALPKKLDQLAMAKALAEADGVRLKYSGCKSMAQLASGSTGATFEDMKFIKASVLSEPARSLIASAKDGELLPPQTGSRGVELYAVCERRALKDNDKKREEAQQELQSQQFEQLAKKHLRDLRQDALIEDR